MANRKTRKQIQDQINRIERTRVELDNRDYERTRTSRNPNRDRYRQFANARNNILRQRGYIGVQNYTNDDDVVMTRAQAKRFDGLRGEARRRYVQNLYEGNSAG